jgi:hypothetical protein
MKLFIPLTCIMLFAAACNNRGGKSEKMSSGDSTNASTATMEELDYPYKLNKPYMDWQPGDKKNAVLVMKMVKAWETKKIDECTSYFADSVEMHFDYLHKMVQHDSLPKMIEQSWADYASVNIKMQDWISVISADKTEEWVTLWYKQSWVDKKGKTDSLAVVNDAKIVNGKIALFDEKTQHFNAPKK